MIKEYIQTEINKGMPKKPSQKKTTGILKKSNPTDNAFTVTFKNQREEVLRNIETLRKSVKLKGRPNPLEKIMTKMAKQEEMQKEKEQQNKQTGKVERLELQSIQEEEFQYPPLDKEGKHDVQNKKIDKKI